MPEPSSSRLTIYTAEAHRIDNRPAYEFVVRAAVEQGLAGATVTRGIAGFGRSHRVHTAKIVDISDDLPVVVTIVDETDRLKTFAEGLRKQYAKGVMTLDEVRQL